MNTSCFFLILISTLSVTPNESSSDAEKGPAAESVVKISGTQSSVEILRPWVKGDPVDILGTGVVIKNGRILTTAANVEYATQLYVTLPQSNVKHLATIEAIAPEVDLAVLKLADAEPLRKLKPIQRFPGLPKAREPVVAIGFAVVGTSLSFTKGIISRIEIVDFGDQCSSLRIQVDAAVNPGNYGGPVLIGEKMIGIISERLADSDNIAYTIPCEEIDFFLNDIADGKYDGKLVFSHSMQFVEAEALRTKLRLGKETTGMLVSSLYQEDSSSPLRRLDLITKIDGHTIDSAGNVRIRDDLNLRFFYLIEHTARAGKLPLEIIRDGKSMEILLPLYRTRTRPDVLRRLHGSRPSYFFWGPLCFTPATSDFLQKYVADEDSSRWSLLLITNRSQLLVAGSMPRSFADEEWVMVATMVPHRVSRGYESPQTCIVDQINGQKVRNLQHLAKIFRELRDDEVTITFREQDCGIMVFSKRDIQSSMKSILDENEIATSRSQDIEPIFQSP